MPLSMPSENGQKPDNWVILHMSMNKDQNKIKIFKILSGYSGGYLDADTWRLSSDIVKVEETDTYFSVYTRSGSTYKLNKQSIGMNSVMHDWWSTTQKALNSIDNVDNVKIDMLTTIDEFKSVVESLKD